MSGHAPSAILVIDAAALADGFTIEDVGEAISLAANQRVLRDPGRNIALPGKPRGSIHGGSEGIHACDATNAWRNVARVCEPRNAVASVIVAAYYVGNNGFYQGADGPLMQRGFPFTEHLDNVSGSTAQELLAELDRAIQQGDQIHACAVTDRYGNSNFAARPIFELLLESAVRSDGALHADNFYRTVTEEFRTTRPAFRWRHVVALARASASQNGIAPPGFDQACDLLGVS